MAGQISLHLLLRQENIFTKSYMMGSEMLLAGSIFLLTLVLVIWQTQRPEYWLEREYRGCAGAGNRCHPYL